MTAPLLALGTLAAAASALRMPHTWQFLTTGLMAWLAREICHRHGIALSRPSASSGRHRWHTTFRLTTTVVNYCIVGGALTSMTILALHRFGPGEAPVMQTDQISATGLHGRADMLFVLPGTVVLESVVIGIVGLMLHTAQRPLWQIYTIIAVTEATLHLYFGAPAVCMAVYAVLCARFYLRHHRLGPLLLGHALTDVLVVLLMTWPLAYRLGFSIALMAAWSAADKWLAAPPRVTRAAP